ncbi:hypothetical protein TSOC_014381, partial [Tetrabaena socialis]
ARASDGRRLRGTAGAKRGGQPDPGAAGGAGTAAKAAEPAPGWQQDRIRAALHPQRLRLPLQPLPPGQPHHRGPAPLHAWLCAVRRAARGALQQAAGRGGAAARGAVFHGGCGG